MRRSSHGNLPSIANQKSTLRAELFPFNIQFGIDAAFLQLLKNLAGSFCGHSASPASRPSFKRMPEESQLIENGHPQVGQQLHA
jgi:hypothetical protein